MTFSPLHSCEILRSRYLRNLNLLSLAVLLCLSPSLAQSQPTPIVQSQGTQPSPEAPSAEQQVPGTISGAVVDSTGASVVGAQVVLTRQDQSTKQEMRSGGDGEFAFANVAPGSYQITISAKGFAPQTSSVLLHSTESYVVPPSTLAPATANTVVQVSPSTASEVAEEQIKIEEKQRVIGVFPNFYISYDPDAVALGPKQKFELAWRTTIDPATFILTGATAGIQQAQNDFSGYGQGAQGYAKRFGASYADNVIDTMLEGAILPTLFKQDPRYFYKGTGSTGSRILYAIGNLVICKGDNKHWQPNYSGILGGLAAGGISNLYYPAKDRGAALTFDNAAIGMGTAAAVNLLQEFFIRKLTHNVPPPTNP